MVGLGGVVATVDGCSWLVGVRLVVESSASATLGISISEAWEDSGSVSVELSMVIKLG